MWFAVFVKNGDNIEMQYLKMLKKDQENDTSMIPRCLITKCLLAYLSSSVGKCLPNLLFSGEFLCEKSKPILTICIEMTS